MNEQISELIAVTVTVALRIFLHSPWSPDEARRETSLRIEANVSRCGEKCIFLGKRDSNHATVV